MRVVDLFAGPGGWDLAALELGLDVLGIEFDDAACATREAAGLKTLQADVGALDPLAVMREQFSTKGGRPRGDGYHPLDGLIASPPCQAFSMAGKGEGRKAIDEYVDAIERTPRLADERKALDWWNLERERIDEVCKDERAHLVLEPLRWALDLMPDWIALEQVEPVLPIWQAMSQVLMDQGYYTWSGVLSAEQYGVPQTRRRAFLIARKREFGIVNMPMPTHARYVAPRTKTHDRQEDSLFDAGERTRIVHPDDRGLLPWVSMAEALGWTEGDLVGLPRLADTDDVIELDGQKYRDRDLRDAGQPAQAVTEKGRSWQRWQLRANAQQNAAVRSADEPAPTIKGGHDTGERVWEPAEVAYKKPYGEGMVERHGDRDGRPADQPAPVITEKARSAEWQPTHLDQRGQTNGRDGQPVPDRSVEDPAPTIAGETRNNAWIDGRPATTVVGSFRPDVISPPGYRKAGDGPRQNQPGAVRVTQQEAAILQSFPADYPWQGSKTKQFQQIGNAVPPLLALAVLGAVVPAVASGEVAA